MEFVRITDEPCALYRCCGEKFEVDPSTECGEVDIRSTQSPLWKIVVFPLWFFLILFHFLFLFLFTVCVALSVLVHPERARYKYYEYYAPWGWRERKAEPPTIRMDYDEPSEPSGAYDPWGESK